MTGGRGGVLDRPLEPNWLDMAMRLGREQPRPADARASLEVMLRDTRLAKEARRKTVTALVRVWIDPRPPARDPLLWAPEHLAATEDLRAVHLVALVAAYPFFADLCASVGRALALEERVLTPALRAALRAAWGDRRTIHNAVQRGVKTLRAFGALTGAPGESLSERGERLPLSADAVRWAAHALLLARGAESVGERELRGAPEWFGIEIPPAVSTLYPGVERHREGGNRTVLAVV